MWFIYRYGGMTTGGGGTGGEEIVLIETFHDAIFMRCDNSIVKVAFLAKSIIIQ